MAKPNNQFEALARDAAERIEAMRDAGQQLSLLPDEPVATDSERAKRGKGRINSQLREWAAQRGLRMPEDVLAEMAGLTSRDDVFLMAMARAEQVLAWAEAGATGYKGSPASPSMAQRVAAFQMIYTAALRAAEALLPYGLAKVTPDAAPVQAVQVIVQGGTAADGPATGPDRARDVTPQAAKLAPPPMPWEMQRNQGLADGAAGGSDGAIRTDGVND